MTVLKFGATWCPGCLVMKPRWAEIEKENPDLKTQYFDFDQHPQIFKKYNIGQDIPVFIFLDKNNQEILRLTGEISKKKLIEIINQHQDK